MWVGARERDYGEREGAAIDGQNTYVASSVLSKDSLRGEAKPIDNAAHTSIPSSSYLMTPSARWVCKHVSRDTGTAGRHFERLTQGGGGGGGGGGRR